MLEINVSTKGFKEFYQQMYDLPSIFKTREYKEFIAKKCMKSLEGIMDIQLFDDYIGEEQLQKYRDANKYEIGGDYILISNDSNLDKGEMYWVSEATKARYPDGISIAYLIEYGSGINGMDAEDWVVNVPSPSKRRDGSWAYKKDDVLYKKVFGTAPKLIYTKLLEEVEKNIQSWTIEYISKKER